MLTTFTSTCLKYQTLYWQTREKYKEKILNERMETNSKNYWDSFKRLLFTYLWYITYEEPNRKGISNEMDSSTQEAVSK